jgi:hypothetical protein
MIFYGFPLEAPVAVLRFPNRGPSCNMWIQVTFWAFPPATEQYWLPIASLISKQVSPYKTHGGTYSPEVSTTKNRSLVDSSKTNHIP